MSRPRWRAFTGPLCPMHPMHHLGLLWDGGFIPLRRKEPTQGVLVFWVVMHVQNRAAIIAQGTRACWKWPQGLSSPVLSPLPGSSTVRLTFATTCQSWGACCFDFGYLQAPFFAAWLNSPCSFTATPSPTFKQLTNGHKPWYSLRPRRAQNAHLAFIVSCSRGSLSSSVCVA